MMMPPEHSEAFSAPGHESDPSDPQEGATVALLAMMLGLSEECSCAGWAHELEYRLWEASPPSVGMGPITIRQVDLLHLLAQESGGWWVWGKGEPEWIALPEWERRFADWQSRRVHHVPTPGASALRAILNTQADGETA